jgi:Flp pilus assembly protein TadD
LKNTHGSWNASARTVEQPTSSSKKSNATLITLLIHTTTPLFALRDPGQPGEAEGVFRAALELRPDFAQAHSNLGVALRKQGKQAEAVAERRKARLAPPRSELARSIERELA